MSNCLFPLDITKSWFFCHHLSDQNCILNRAEKQRSHKDFWFSKRNKPKVKLNSYWTAAVLLLISCFGTCNLNENQYGQWRSPLHADLHLVNLMSDEFFSLRTIIYHQPLINISRYTLLMQTCCK